MTVVTSAQGRALVAKIHRLTMLVDNLELAAATRDVASLGPVPDLGPIRCIAAGDAAAGDVTAGDAANSAAISQSNDDCAAATLIGFGTYTGTTGQASNDGQSVCGASTDSPDVWFRYTAGSSGTVVVDTVGSSFDTVLSVHLGCPGAGSVEVDCNDDFSGLQAGPSFNAPAGIDYLIRLAGFDGLTGSYVLNLSNGGEISGSVTGQGTSDPVYAEVQLYHQSGATVGSASTVSGQYLLPTLVPGSYYLKASSHFTNQGLVAELYNNVHCWPTCDLADGELVPVVTGATTSGIDFILERAGTITGTVRDAATLDPIPGVTVKSYTSYGSTVDVATTGSGGTYWLSGHLATGYRVMATAPDHGDQLYDAVPCTGGPGVGCSLADGTPVATAIGSETSGIDFFLNRLASIAGTVTRAGILLDSTLSFGGSYTFTDLGAGTFYLRTFTPPIWLDQLYDGIPCWGAAAGCDVTTGTPIAVGLNTQATGISFMLPASGGITGQVLDEVTLHPVPSILVEAWDSTGRRAIDRADENGVYQIQGLGTGTYYIATNDYSIAYLNELYNDIPCPHGPPASCDPTKGTPVPVTGGETTRFIDLALTPVSPTPVITTGITGTVTDRASGLGIAGVAIDVWEQATGKHVATAYSVPDGSYGVPLSSAGPYLVSTDNNLGLINQLWQGNSCPQGSVFTGTCSLALGTRVVVVYGKVTDGIDFQLSGPLFEDGFESGNLTRWSSSQG